MDKDVLVYSLKLAQRLCQRGYKIIETRPNPKKPWLNCFLFEKTEGFEIALREELSND